MGELFKKMEITEGINLYLYNTNKYKTISIRTFLYTKVDEEITKTSLIPFVLARGTKKYPDNLTIRRELANYYGAQLGTGVTRRGDAVLVDFRMEMVSPHYVSEDSYVEKVLDVLQEVIFNPRKEGKGFKESFVNTEKENTKNRIMSLINDKGRYAFERAVQIMCPNDPYKYYKFGKIEDLPNIDSVNLYEKYQEILKNSPMDIYVVGHFDEDKIVKMIKARFDVPREKLLPLEKPINTELLEFKEVTEEMDINQGKLVMGLKTPITMEHELYPALLMYNGILGAFSHSKLFQNVREKASLAYYAGSNIESLKGLLFIFAGIEPATYTETVDIVKKQLQDIRDGKITDKEFAYTLAGLESGLLETFDEVGGQIGFAVDGGIMGKELTITEILEKIKLVTKEEVVKVAESIELELIYFLKGKGDSHDS